MKNFKTFGMASAAMAVGVTLVTALYAGDDRTKTPLPRDVTLTGKVVDLQNSMTGRFTSSDHAKCTQECLRAGVPAALETDEGLVIIGEGVKGPQRTLTPFAFQVVEIKGKLYEKQGLRYIDMTSAKAAKPPQEPASEDEEEAWPEYDEGDEEPSEQDVDEP